MPRGAGYNECIHQQSCQGKNRVSMSNRVKILFISLSVGIVVFVIAGTFGVRASSNDGAYRQLGVYSEVLSRIRSEYVEEPNIATVTDGSLHGLLESLDANSSYLSPKEYTTYKKLRAVRPTRLGWIPEISSRLSRARAPATCRWRKFMHC